MQVQSNNIIIIVSSIYVCQMNITSSKLAFQNDASSIYWHSNVCKPIHCSQGKLHSSNIGFPTRVSPMFICKADFTLNPNDISKGYNSNPNWHSIGCKPNPTYVCHTNIIPIQVPSLSDVIPMLICNTNLLNHLNI